MTVGERGQVSSTAAEIYEDFFVPALFAEWAPRVVATAQLKSGQHVLDVACGTGIVTRAMIDAVGASGSVVGVDINSGMLAVAEKKAPGAEFQNAPAEQLPFSDASFDAVVCQYGLMFFDDRKAALAEMVRVLKPGGQLVVAVWDTLENTPGYRAMVNLLEKLFGADVADSLRAPFNLGDRAVLKSYFDSLDLTNLKIDTPIGTARFPSLQGWIYTDIKGWVLADVLTDAQVDRLLEAAETDLARFVHEDGTVTFDSPAHIVSAQRE